MTATAATTDALRSEAARLAFALLRFEGAAAHARPGSRPSGALQIGTEAYVFLPSWREVPFEEVEAFLVGLPSPALLAPTTVRGVIALTLVHELSGDRRHWAEKTLSNFVAGLEDMAQQLDLSPTSRILLEFDEDSHVFSLAGVREWAQQMAVQVGWNVSSLESDVRADACMNLMRSDRKPFRGRSCMIRPGWTTDAPEGEAT